jgi:hypothetical protein
LAVTRSDKLKIQDLLIRDSKRLSRRELNPAMPGGFNRQEEKI